MGEVEYFDGQVWRKMPLKDSKDDRYVSQMIDAVGCCGTGGIGAVVPMSFTTQDGRTWTENPPGTYEKKR